MAARSRHKAAPYPLSRTPQGAAASAPQPPAQPGEGSHPHPSPNLPCDVPLSPAMAAGPQAGCGRSGPVKAGRTLTPHGCKVPVPVPPLHSFRVGPATAGVPRGTALAAHGCAPHQSQCRIPPSRDSASPSRQGDRPTPLRQSPGDATAHGGGLSGGSPPVYPHQPSEEKEQPRRFLRTLKPGAERTPPPLAPSECRGAARRSPAPLASVSGTRVCVAQTLSPWQGLLSGRHSSSLWFYIKQTLPASSPAGPGNRAADLGHLGTVLPLYLDFGAKFSICEILCKPRQRGHREVGALPARRGSRPGQQLSITVPASKQAPASLPRRSCPRRFFTAAKNLPVPRRFAPSSA